MATFFEDGELKGQSKGLKRIAIELGYDVNKKRLPQIVEMLKEHPAFAAKTKLELIGQKYNIKVLYFPKFHCELNPIEGLWCFQKQFVRSRTDQTFQTMKKLIKESRLEFKKKQMNEKLVCRFWNIVEAYSNGDSYFEVLTEHCGNRKENVTSHRRISDKNV